MNNLHSFGTRNNENKPEIWEYLFDEVTAVFLGYDV
jgi:hypothetical protein